MTRAQNLTPVQLAWCAKTMPAFAKAYADVCRRDAEVAANRARFDKPTKLSSGAVGTTDTDGAVLQFRIGA